MENFIAVTLTLLLVTFASSHKPGVTKDLYYNDGHGTRVAHRTVPAPAGIIGPNASRVAPAGTGNGKSHVAKATVNLSGKYYIKQCFDGQRTVSTPRWYKFTLEITAHAAGPKHTYIGYKLKYTVGNKLWAHITQVRDGSWVMSNDGQTLDHYGSAKSDEQKAEKFVLDFQKFFTGIKVDADVVTFYGKNGSRMVLVKAKAQKHHP